jgi:hypothetical protein
MTCHVNAVSQIRIVKILYCVRHSKQMNLFIIHVAEENKVLKQCYAEKHLRFQLNCA